MRRSLNTSRRTRVKGGLGAGVATVALFAAPPPAHAEHLDTEFTIYNRSAVPVIVSLCNHIQTSPLPNDCNPDANLPPAKGTDDPNPAHTNMVGDQLIANITYPHGLLQAMAFNPLFGAPEIDVKDDSGSGPEEIISLVEGEVQQRLSWPRPVIVSRKADTVNKQIVLELFTPPDEPPW